MVAIRATLTAAAVATNAVITARAASVTPLPRIALASPTRPAIPGG